MASLPRLPKNSITLWNSPIQLFDSADHRAGTLFEHRSARVAEIGLVLPQAVFDPGGVRNVASAEPEGVGRTRGRLLGGATIVLRKGTCCAKECCCRCDGKTVGFRNHIGSLTLIGVASGSHPRPAALRKKSGLQRHSRAHKSRTRARESFFLDRPARFRAYIHYTV